MKQIIAGSVLALAGCSASNESGTEYDPAHTEAEVRAALDAYADAINSGDIDRAGEFYDEAPGFYWVERARLQYRSAEDARISLEELGDSGFSVAIRFEEVHVAPLGPEAAIVSSRFATQFGPPEGEPFAFAGWQTVGMVLRSDGWRIAAGHTEAITPSGE